MVTMTCMTKKQKFDVPDDEVEVVVLHNGRYAFRATCPWEGKNGRQLTAFKFCSKQAYVDFCERAKGQDVQDESESEHTDEEIS